MRRALVFAVMALVLLVSARNAEARPRDDFLADVNARRDCATDLEPTGARLLNDARDWSREMARTGFRHSELRIGQWSIVGEVIAYGPSLDWAVRALFRSPPHRRILRACEYDFMAVGVYREDGDVWLTGRLYAV